MPRCGRRPPPRHHRHRHVACHRIHRMLNDDPSRPIMSPGARVVAAFKGGSPDIEASATPRGQIRRGAPHASGVEIVPDIPTLCRKVDAVLLESVDGRVHLAAGQAGDRGAQTRVHRQAAGRHPRRRARDRPAGESGRRAVVQLFEPALRRDRRDDEIPRHHRRRPPGAPAARAAPPARPFLVRHPSRSSCSTR